MSDETEQYTDPYAAMEATMAAKFDELQASDDAETEQAPREEADAEEDAQAAEETDATDTADADDEGEEDDQGSDDDEGAEDDDASLSPPERWSAADKEAFSALPREAQELVLKRESDVEKHLSQKSQEIAEERKRLGAVADLMEQRREAWALEGMSPDQAVSQLMSLSDYAGRDPQGFIKWFAEQRGIDVSSLAAGSEDYGDPEIKSLKAEIERLKAMEQQRTTTQQQTQRQAVQQAIQEFAGDAQAAPYFDELQSDIASLLPSVRQANPNAGPKEWLKLAYDKAVWANETTRQKEIDRQRKADEATRRTASQKAADKAKKAAGSNVRSKPAAVEGKEKRSMEDTMAAAYDAAVGAA